jgi:hypothetical protein
VPEASAASVAGAFRNPPVERYAKEVMVVACDLAALHQNLSLGKTRHRIMKSGGQRLVFIEKYI